MKDIWKLSQSLNIHKCSHIYREANRVTDCLDLGLQSLGFHFYDIWGLLGPPKIHKGLSSRMERSTIQKIPEESLDG